MFDEDLRIAMIIRGERRVKGLEVDGSQQVLTEFYTPFVSYGIEHRLNS